MRIEARWIPTAILFCVLAISSPNLMAEGSAGKDAEKDAQISTIFKNGVRQGKLEAAMLFNSHVSVFDIDTKVNDNIAVLEGSVKSGVEKDIAEQVALSIDGIDKVENRIKVDPNAKEKSRDSIQNAITKTLSDAKITVAIESKLAINQHLSAMGIDVETENQNVTLKGEVASDSHKSLAELLVKNTSGVKSVNNELKIKKKDS
ncbi:MAG: BON domain-containing protein [Ketobacteraceae bacterium]|nr:BON domain-containing protein [Ketobacteraceae bacterium]